MRYRISALLGIVITALSSSYVFHLFNCNVLKFIKKKKKKKKKKFPTQWQTGKVSCQHKKDTHTDCNNYRPITLLSIPSKVFEGIICDKIDQHLADSNLISEHQ